MSALLTHTKARPALAEGKGTGQAEHSFGAAGIANVDLVAGFGAASQVHRRAAAFVYAESNIDLCLNGTYDADQAGAHDRANGVGGPARADMGQRWQVGLLLAFS